MPRTNNEEEWRGQGKGGEERRRGEERRGEERRRRRMRSGSSVFLFCLTPIHNEGRLIGVQERGARRGGGEDGRRWRGGQERTAGAARGTR